MTYKTTINAMGSYSIIPDSVSAYGESSEVVATVYDKEMAEKICKILNATQGT